jgi:hypothetical protein
MTLYEQRKRKTLRLADKSNENLVKSNSESTRNVPFTRSQAKFRKPIAETYLPEQASTNVCQSTMTKKGKLWVMK